MEQLNEQNGTVDYSESYRPDKKVKVIKKDGSTEDFNVSKVITAIGKSAYRALTQFTEEEKAFICQRVVDRVNQIGKSKIPIAVMHNIVEESLEQVKPIVAKSYRDYRNYKQDFVRMMDDVYKKSQSIMYIGDKENSNTDSALVATKRSLVFNQFNKELYQKFFMTTEEIQACRDGYIYVHDMSARRDTINCCLFDVKSVLSGGFEMGNIWYNEPKTLDVAFDVIGDITLSAASQQYGGFTLPEIDTILEPYAEKSYAMYIEEYMGLGVERERAEKVAYDKVRRDFEQGFQGLEYKFNTVGSSRGDYPFITITLGLARGRFGKLASITALNVRRGGQGKKGNKKPVLFPKIVFLYDENLHGKGKELEDVFEAGVLCSSKTMYPDWLSLTGEGYVPSIYKKYGKVISNMGCVDGQEIITYRFGGVLFVESFRRMWERMSDNFEVKEQPAGPAHLYIDLKDVEIWDKEKGFVNTERIIRNTSTEWVDVHLSNGRRLLCTTDHPFTTADGVTKHACELTEDDRIPVNSEQYSTEEKEFDADAAWLYGFLLCDGCYSSSGIFASIALDSENDIEEKFHELFPKYFGLATRTVVQERGEKGNYKDLCAYSDNNGGMKRAVGRLKDMFGGTGKKDRHIPTEVFTWNRDAKLSFMAGMIDADGYFNPTSHGGTTVQIGSTNKELVLQQMALAQALGMPAKIYHNHYNKENQDKIRYRVEFFATEELAEYLVSEKKKQYFKERSASSKCTLSGDKVEEAAVMEVIPVSRTDYSYDVTTGSAHFDVSGIWSHNCRAFLSPWYERGGMEPADENDKPVFVGRFNIGAVSLHLPMILAKARQEGQDFYEVLDYYLNLIRQLHIRTYAYLGEMRASTNPMGYCEGGFYGGHLDPHDKIKPLLKPMTASFGITALNELQMLYNKKSLVQDGAFALEVMEYINSKVNRFKKEDGNLYAIYGTPAENLCLAGDSVVQTYGGHKQIKDLSTDDLVYSFNTVDHKVELKKVLYAARTGINRQVVKIIMDNGQEIVCTPDHKIGVRRMPTANGRIIGKEYLEYVEAKDLKPGNRIKSNYIKLNKRTGRLECSIYHDGAKQLVQDVNAEYIYGPKPEGYVTHHKDEDKLNNLFDNLEYKTDADHRRYHMEKTIRSYCHTSESQSGEKNSFYGKHHAKEANERNRAAHIGKSIECLSVDGNHVRSFGCADDAEKAGFTRHAVVQACRGKGRISVHPSGHGYKKMLWFYTDECEQSAFEANHKVVSVEYLEEPMDVYDITVEDNHNFFVGGNDGILVHNCGLQIKQFRAKYGIIEGVSDREYVSNSFHCHVTEDITPIEKQDLEYRFWNLFNGGKIQYVKYPIDYNLEAIRTLIRRAMDMGLYEGVNMSLAYCDDCGHQELEMDVCPKCGSRNLTKIDRMNGYLSYSRVHGDTRLNDAKMAEIAERKSM